MGPHIILPLAEPDDPTQHIPRVDAHTHADVHSCGLTNLPGAERSVTYCRCRATLGVLAMAGHQGGRQSFPLREVTHPVPGNYASSHPAQGPERQELRMPLKPMGHILSWCPSPGSPGWRRRSCQGVGGAKPYLTLRQGPCGLLYPNYRK